MARTTTPVVSKAQSTAIAAIQDELRKQAAAMSDRVAPGTGSNVIKPAVNGFKMGTLIAPAPMDVVILDFVARNVYYEGAYDADSIQPPNCFAQGFAKNGGAPQSDMLVPNPQAQDIQAASCAVCPLNAFKTGRNGKGKACQNRRILAVLPPDSTKPEDDLWLLNLSPSSLQDFDNYVDALRTLHGLPPVAFVTELRLKPAGASVAVTFEAASVKPNANIAAHFARQAEAHALLERIPANFLVANAPEAPPVPQPKTRSRKAG